MMARFSGCATRTLPADMAARLRPAFSYTPAQQTYTSDTTTTTTTTISLSS
jgi:hypothetical protein